MSDEGVPCYRRMSAPSSAEELEEAAGYLRDACGCLADAANLMHWTEADQFGSALQWCAETISTVSARLRERAERVRDQARREQSFELGYVEAGHGGCGVEISTRATSVLSDERRS